MFAFCDELFIARVLEPGLNRVRLTCHTDLGRIGSRTGASQSSTSTPVLQSILIAGSDSSWFMNFMTTDQVPEVEFGTRSGGMNERELLLGCF